MLKVGFMYRSVPKFEDKNEVWHTIFHKVPRGQEGRCFVGLGNDGYIRFFDDAGKDEYMLCGGYWYQLDLSTETRWIGFLPLFPGLQ